MSLDDEHGLGDLFGVQAEDVAVVYPIEELLVDRLQLRQEGTTNAGFTPLLHRFSHATTAKEGAVVEDRTASGQFLPLRVHFRNKRHSLWGHKLWNAAKYLVKRMDSHMIDVRGKTVLELGAGLGVPSLTAFLNGARCVVVTDYPDEDLLEILRMNVRANCTPDMLDADAAKFLLQEAVRIKAAQLGSQHEDGKVVELSAEERERALCTQCVVQPLLWGNDEHIRLALSHTGGCGYEIVLLSDILFNHICNDDLADTVSRLLQRSPQAAAYCVFSHHRAHKQVEDLEFFDKCVARGLRFEQVDEENYPLMFPDDPGPEEIRRPVKVYKLVHHFDGAGAPLESGFNSYDVVIQGTGIVESMLSAALARSGIRVLHCDGQGDYGGAFRTLTVEQMREYIALNEGLLGEVNDCGGDISGEGREEIKDVAVISVDRMDELDVRVRRRFLFDLIPVHYLSKGDVVEQLVASDMARHIEFQCFSGFLFMYPSGDNKFQLQSIPLSRAQVFSASHVDLMQKRRLMKFVKDVEATLAEQLHAHTADIGDDPQSQAAVVQARDAAEKAGRLFAQEASNYPTETLSEMMTRKYGVTGAALDTITLLQQLDTPPKDGLVRSVELVRQVLMSVGAFSGSTPFLQPIYGTAEIPQNMCRISAVWDGTFVLQRSVHRVAIGVSSPSVEMSNRQHVKAKVVVVPRVLANRFTGTIPSPASVAVEEEATVARFSRVVIAAKAPLISWEALRALGCQEHGIAGMESDPLWTFPPLVFALCYVRPGVVVHVQQVSAASEHAPNDGLSVVVHFTVNHCDMTAKELHEFVEHSFVRRTSTASQVSDGIVGLDYTQIIFFASFVLCERREALRSTVAVEGEEGVEESETSKAHPYAVEGYRRRQQKRQHRFESTGSGEISCAVVPVPTLFQNLMDDGAYVHAARQAYDVVLAKLKLKGKDGKRYEFLERLPPLPSQDA